jgi:hypothetical protein
MDLQSRTAIAICGLVVFAAALAGVQLLAGDQIRNADLRADTGTLLEETFDASDLLYGPQSWRPHYDPIPLPAGGNAGEEDAWYLMFVDLRGTPQGIMNNRSCMGTLQVHYRFEHLAGTALFSVYGYRQNAPQGTGVSWTNRPEGSGASGYVVVGGDEGAAAMPWAEPMTGPSYSFVRVANTDGPVYDDFHNGTYHFWFKKKGGGLNSIHITTDPGEPEGQVTATKAQEGDFSITYTGDTMVDEILLMIAVNRPQTEEYRIHLTSRFVEG